MIFPAGVRVEYRSPSGHTCHGTLYTGRPANGKGKGQGTQYEVRREGPRNKIVLIPLRWIMAIESKKEFEKRCGK